MVAVEILKFPTSSPADTSPLQRLSEAGYEASQILAVIGKTEGESRLVGAFPWSGL
jgi:cyanuric acid amidohydrolase